MKRKNTIVTVMAIVVFRASSFVYTTFESAIVDEIKIGNQIWAKYNLDVDKFRNGEAILHAKTREQWEQASKDKRAAWCYYDNSPENGRKYGKLYNWYAVNDPRANS